MHVRVQRPRPAMLQFDDLQPRDRLVDAATVPPPRVQFLLPQDENPVADAVLQRLELSGQFGMEQRGDAVRLRMIQRAVQQQICIWPQPSLPALLPRHGIMPGQPHPQCAGTQLVETDSPVLDHEPRNR